MSLVTSERRGHVLLVTMQREEKRNAVNQEMTDALDEALNLLEDDDDLWVGILAGMPKAFSAGSDMKNRPEPTERGGRYGVVRRPRAKPLIAVVEGPAIGGGFEMAMACDLVVASTTAVFGLPEAERGLVAAGGGLVRGPRVLPLNLLKELIVTGDTLGAERAHALGFVNRLTAPGEALTEALGLAVRICENSPVAVQESLRALERSLGTVDDLAWRATFVASDTARASEDAAEGVQAFFERRPPSWTGR